MCSVGERVAHFDKRESTRTDSFWLTASQPVIEEAAGKVHNSHCVTNIEAVITMDRECAASNAKLFPAMFFCVCSRQSKDFGAKFSHQR